MTQWSNLCRVFLFPDLPTAADFFCAHQRMIPPKIVVALLPAILLELTLYLSLAVPKSHARVSQLRPPQIALALFAAAITLPVASWCILLPVNNWTYFALLLFLPAVILLKGRLFRLRGLSDDANRQALKELVACAPAS